MVINRVFNSFFTRVIYCSHPKDNKGEQTITKLISDSVGAYFCISTTILLSLLLRCWFCLLFQSAEVQGIM